MIDGETERMMLNWARWRAGSSMGVAMTGAYENAVRDAWDVPMPLLNGEAIEVNQAVDRLEEHLRQAIVEYWFVSAGNASEKARMCGCSKMALYRRLDQAHRFVHAYRRELKARSERARKALSHSHGQISER